MPQSSAPADLLRELIGRTFGGLSSDTRRAQTILRDAVPKLVGSFTTLQDQLQAQMQLIQRLSRDLSSGNEQGGLGKGMRVIIDTFVADMVSVSSQSMRIVERVTEMGDDVTRMTASVEQIDEMTGATRIIALNAEIEANRIVEGAAFRVVAEETKRLAREASFFSEQIRTSVHSCRERLEHTRDLVGTLASHDMTVALRAQSNLANTVASIDEANGQLLTTLGQIDQQINAAMTALQFDDIMTQLLSTIDRRLVLLQQVWLESLHPTLSRADVEAMLSVWEQHREALLEGTQVVTQSTVATGTSELF